MAEIKAMKPQSGCLQSHIGVPGESAYQIAVDHGYVGTEEEWLESLKGADWVPTAAEKSAIAAEAAALIDVSGKENSSNKVTSIGSSPTDAHYPSEKAVKTFVEGKGYLTQHQSLSNYYNKAESDGRYLQSHQDISGKEDKSNKVTSIGSSPTDTQYPSAAAVKAFVEGKGYLTSHQSLSSYYTKTETDNLISSLIAEVGNGSY